MYCLRAAYAQANEATGARRDEGPRLRCPPARGGGRRRVRLARAHKHTDAPGEDAIVDQIVQGVLNELCEYFDVDDEDRPA
jgi:hypothetical protein